MSKIMRKKHVRVENNDLLCAELVKFVEKDTKFDIWSVICRICMHFSDQNWLILVVSSMESSKNGLEHHQKSLKSKRKAVLGGMLVQMRVLGPFLARKSKFSG